MGSRGSLGNLKPFSIRPINSLFVGFFQTQRCERLIRHAHVLVWREDLERRQLAGSTLHRKLAALSSLFEYLCERNAVTTHPVDCVKRPNVESYEGRTPHLTKPSLCDTRRSMPQAGNLPEDAGRSRMPSSCGNYPSGITQTRPTSPGQRPGACRQNLTPYAAGYRPRCTHASRCSSGPDIATTSRQPPASVPST